MRKQYLRCPQCKSRLDRGEHCECQKLDLQPELISKVDLIGIGRAIATAAKNVIDAKTGKFIDPIIQAEYEEWLLERYGEKRPTAPSVGQIQRTPRNTT